MPLSITASVPLKERRAIIGAGIFCLFIIIATVLLVGWLSFRVDFSSLYLAIKLAWQNQNPYQMGSADFLPYRNTLPVNLNPPFVLWALRPLLFFPYRIALFIFVATSFILGLVAASLCGHYFLETGFWKRYKNLLLLMYCTLFPVFLNLAIGQMGSLLFFFILLGYHGWRTQKNLLTACCWGIAISMKLFPAVLLIYCLQQKKIRLFFGVGLSALLWSSIPLLGLGADSYLYYLAVLQEVSWYGSSWNASLLGFLFRISGSITPGAFEYWLLRSLWLLALCISLFWYGKSQYLQKNALWSFAFALVLMIFLSPFGWIYYFSLLIPALCLSYHQAMRGSANDLMLWCMSFMLINFPMDHAVMAKMTVPWLRLSLFSFQTYGLLILLYLCIFLAKAEHKESSDGKRNLFWPIYCNQLFGLFILFYIILSRLSHAFF
jgi:alpha-1,2-mannosyltransferase